MDRHQARPLKPVLIGLQPSHNVGIDYIPLTGSDTGKRLMAWAGVSSPQELADHFELINLLKGPSMYTPRDKMEAAALGVLDAFLVPGRRFIFLGNDVIKAMPRWIRPTIDWWQWQTIPLRGPGREVYVAKHPHPSPLTRLWNDQANVDKASDFLRAAMGREDVVQ